MENGAKPRSPRIALLAHGANGVQKHRRNGAGHVTHLQELMSQLRDLVPPKSPAAHLATLPVMETVCVGAQCSPTPDRRSCLQILSDAIELIQHLEAQIKCVTPPLIAAAVAAPGLANCCEPSGPNRRHSSSISTQKVTTTHASPVRLVPITTHGAGAEKCSAQAPYTGHGSVCLPRAAIQSDEKQEPTVTAIAAIQAEYARRLRCMEQYYTQRVREVRDTLVARHESAMRELRKRAGLREFGDQSSQWSESDMEGSDESFSCDGPASSCRSRT